ncbi:hypothetical protein CA54_17000 [Symmachiella macrocystis]|uniref:Uncharacterized protein n=1 Tax=Symmachiella macrocystis TaxID=2527985 RepID=A0A5C6BQG5_9PLAN|nr:hypothetical protein [Symmachiella macrocystis]TWU12874.1 hypothetical protein CA54_17000 [Symmachiella macrocystis]
MAGDWVKMRGSLLTDLKVAAMARHLEFDRSFQDWFVADNRIACDETVTEVCNTRVTVSVTVSALLVVWSSVNVVVKDDNFVPGVSILDLDTISGVPGFGSAMSSVGWVIESQDPGGLIFPNFNEYNVPVKERALTNAERQAVYRERKKGQEEQSGGGTGNGKRNETVTKSDENHVTKSNESNDIREDKIREDIQLPNGSCLSEQNSDMPAEMADLGAFAVKAGGVGWFLGQSQVDEWANLFPSVDVEAECRKARAWLEVNPKRRKTSRGMPAFLLSWIKRSDADLKASRGSGLLDGVRAFAEGVQ